MERMAKKPTKKRVITEAQRAKAEAFLKNVAGPQFDPKEFGKRKNMMKVMKAADEHESGKYKLKPVHRRTKKVVKRAGKRLLRVRKKELEARFNAVPRGKMMKKVRKKIRNKIRNLPASTPAGSQQHIANQMMRHLRRQFKRRTRKKVKKELEKEKKKMPKF